MYFKSATLAPLMTWHCNNTSDNDVMRIQSNCRAWKFIKDKYNQMKDAKCVLFEVSTNGFNPHGPSLWPIIQTLVNLNPKLAIHKGHNFLNTILYGK